MGDLNKFKEGISKTGFVLENKVAQLLVKNGWSVISNKYYEDDFEDKIREIDLIAYRVSKVQNFDVYTCLIISCKKNESNVWALLCREINLKDPNSDWWPLHTWSNKKSIQHQLSLSGKAKEYYKGTLRNGIKALSDPKVEVFAFQEMDSKTGVPKNDKAIFDSITSLIKAQSYEMGALPERKKAEAVYQFNLLSVVDAQLIRLHFAGESIDVSNITDEQFVSRYIINQQQSFSRIRFLTANFFQQTIPEYAKLHLANSKWLDEICNEFYLGIEKDNKRLNLYLEEFVAKIKWPLFRQVHKVIDKYYEPKNIYLSWSDSSNALVIYADAEEDILKILNSDEKIQSAVSSALKEIYRYSGKFIFDNDIPF